MVYVLSQAICDRSDDGVGKSDVFFFKQKAAYEILSGLGGSEMCIKDRNLKILSQKNYQKKLWSFQKIKTKKLDRILDAYDFNDIDFMNIDVEGHELKVLMGAKELITKHKPTILIELLPHIEDSEHVRTLLKEMGYGEPVERPEAVFIFTHTSSQNIQ